MPNVHHATLCLGDLLGYPVEACGVPVVGGGRTIHAADGKIGMFFDEPPEIVAMRRWRAGDFFGVERDFAKGVARGFGVPELEGIAAAIRPEGKSPSRTLAELRAAADLTSPREAGQAL